MAESRRVDIIRERIISAFNPSHLEVIDESDEHLGHPGHHGRGGSHFAISISAPTLNHITRIEAHRMIYALFTDMMPHDIHALRISVIQQ